jgi:murein DD-endopeptidase MepM/ murein hydrolase activator NlpD
LLNALSGVRRAIARRRTPDRDPSLTVRYLHRRVVRLTRRLVDRVAPIPTRRPPADEAPRHLGAKRLQGARPLRTRGRFVIDRRLLRVRLSSERTLPIAVAFVVILASIISLGPSAVRPVGAAQGTSAGVRLTIGGGSGSGAADPELSGRSTTGVGAYIDDGTVYKPVAVNTTVESGSALLRHYTVKAKDTLTGIASYFGVSMMTLYWANHMTAKDQLKVGEVLVIPPVDGLVVTVIVGDTLDSLAANYDVDPNAIISLNGLTDPNLVVGQVLILPGAQGAPIPTPTPIPTRAPTPAPIRQPSVSVSVSSGGIAYTGGAWAWPDVGGNNYISQYFHYGHLGIDIAAQYGTPIVAALAGTVVQAGWLSGGGGYQVFIYHGNGMYTVYLHMSAVIASKGESVGRGQLIGRVGMTGNATGPHCHFGVSFGYPWMPGSYFVNPLNYYH